MDKDKILKLIWSHEQAIKEGLRLTTEATEIQKQLMEFLDAKLPSDSLPGLRYRRLKTDRRLTTWWSNDDGYPIGEIWDGKFQPLLTILEQYLAGKTIKNRLEGEGLFIESRKQGEDGDEHILVGKREGDGEKAHLVVDTQTGEIRVEGDRQEPTELVARIETILTLPNGKKIKSTREALSLDEERMPQELAIYVAPTHKEEYFLLEVFNNSEEDIVDFRMDMSWLQNKIESREVTFIGAEERPLFATPAKINVLR